ncbi:hypothetical protein CVT25_012977, partial [Psilocybe cyanescens]
PNSPEPCQDLWFKVYTLLKEGIEKGPTGKDVLRPRYDQVREAVVRFEDEERRKKQIEQEQRSKAAPTARKVNSRGEMTPAKSVRIDLSSQPIRGLRSTTRAVAAPDQVLWIGPPKKCPSATASGNTATSVVSDVEEVDKPKNKGKAKAVSKRTAARAVDSTDTDDDDIIMISTKKSETTSQANNSMDTDDDDIIMISTKKSETTSQANMKAPALDPPKQKGQTVPQATTSRVAAAASQPLLKNTSRPAAMASEPTPKAAKLAKRMPQAMTSRVAATASQLLLKNTSRPAAMASEPTPKAAKLAKR